MLSRRPSPMEIGNTRGIANTLPLDTLETLHLQSHVPVIAPALPTPSFVSLFRL